MSMLSHHCKRIVDRLNPYAASTLCHNAGADIRQQRLTRQLYPIRITQKVHHHPGKEQSILHRINLLTEGRCDLPRRIFHRLLHLGIRNLPYTPLVKADIDFFL